MSHFTAKTGVSCALLLLVFQPNVSHAEDEPDPFPHISFAQQRVQNSETAPYRIVFEMSTTTFLEKDSYPPVSPEKKEEVSYYPLKRFGDTTVEWIKRELTRCCDVYVSLWRGGIVDDVRIHTVFPPNGTVPFGESNLRMIGDLRGTDAQPVHALALATRKGSPAPHSRPDIRSIRKISLLGL